MGERDAAAVMEATPRRPEPATGRRRTVDVWLGRGLVALMVAVTILCFGPIEVAWLYVGGRVNHAVGSTGIGLIVAILGMLFTLVLTIGLLRRLEAAWVLVRRSAGHGQRRGVLENVFVVAVGVTVVVFAVWFLGFSGASPVPLNLSY